VENVGRAFLRLFLAAVALLGATGASGQVQGVTDNEVVFGMSAAFSGTAKELGHQMKVGYEVAFAAANDAGGTLGRKLRLVAEDDGNEPGRALTVVKDLVEQKKVFALVGTVGSAAIEAYLPYLFDKRMIMFGSLSGADFLRNDPPDRWIFNFRAGYAEETEALVRYLVKVRHFKPSQIAFFEQKDSYGATGWRGFARQMRRYDYDTERTLRVGYQRNTLDVDEAVKLVHKHAGHLKAVVMVATHHVAAKFIEKLRGVDLVYGNVSAVVGRELADELVQLGPTFAQGVITTQVVPLPDSRATAVLKDQEALHRYAPDERPDFVSLEAYLAAQVLMEGLKRAGKNLNTDSLVDALEGIHGFEMGIGVQVSFGPSEHQGSHKIWGTILDARGNSLPLELE